MVDESIQQWKNEMKSICSDHERLIEAGLWVVGADDLLSIIGRSRRETYHSAILAWLLNPLGKHGLGTMLLEALLTWCGVPDSASDLHRARPEVEKHQTSADEKATRADIVVFAPSFTLIIENKVDAGEQDGQCDRLYEAFSNNPGPVFIFLTPDGREPTTATEAGTKVWKQLSYSDLAELLSEALNSSAASKYASGRSTAENYLSTLGREFKPKLSKYPKERIHMNPIDDERILFYLKHQQRIDEWALLAKEAQETADKFLCSCLQDIEALAKKLGSDVKVDRYDYRDNKVKQAKQDEVSRILLYRSSWCSDDKSYPDIGIGLLWWPSSVTFVGFNAVGAGVLINIMDDAKRKEVISSLRQSFKDKPSPDLKLDNLSSRDWWAFKRAEPAGGEYWNDLAAYRKQLVESVELFWNNFEPLITEKVRLSKLKIASH